MGFGPGRRVQITGEWDSSLRLCTDRGLYTAIISLLYTTSYLPSLTSWLFSTTTPVPPHQLPQNIHTHPFSRHDTLLLLATSTLSQEHFHTSPPIPTKEPRIFQQTLPSQSSTMAKGSSSELRASSILAVCVSGELEGGCGERWAYRVVREAVGI